MVDFYTPGSPMSPWDRVPWSNFSGKPTVYAKSEPNFERFRQFKFVFDGLRAAQLNVSLSPGDFTLETQPPMSLRDKIFLHDVLKAAEKPVLNQYRFERSVIAEITNPIIMKPQFGKGGYDRTFRSVYKIFQNGNQLLNSLDNEQNNPYTDDQLMALYFIEDAVYEPGLVTNKVLAFCLINGSGQVKVPHVDEQKWSLKIRGQSLDEAVRRPITTHDAAIADLATAVASAYNLRNCCLYVQAILHDGVYYFNDADVRIPTIYAKTQNAYLANHLLYMFDQVSDITRSPDYVFTRTLTSLFGDDYTTHLQLLEDNVNDYEGGFYWIQRYCTIPADENGSYMLMTKGSTEAFARNEMDDFVASVT